MKLFVIILTGLIVLSIAFVYVIIPHTIQLAEIVKIAGNAKAGNRSLMNKSEWENLRAFIGFE
ncbi:MAG TPA: hypothetical protein VK369_01125 [Segetibacter sp.]|nr:hypothetical protein [Segetibacter sp.]